MTRIQKRGLCWLIAALMTAAMMSFVLACTDILYAINDDAAIMHAVLGYETGEPAAFHLFIHGLLLWPLGWLTRLFPGLPWFSYAQLFMLALSCTVIAKSIMQSFVKYRKPLWMGAVLAAAFLLTLGMKYMVDLTFTTTSGLLGAAAAAQMLSIEHDRGGKRVVTGMMGALMLVCLSYVLRLSAILPVMGYCGLIFCFIVWEHYGLGKSAKRSIRPMAVSLALVASVIAAVLGIRQFELTRPSVQAYSSWQEARTEIMDYIDIVNVPQEAFELVGWDEATVNMAKHWCYLDSDLSTEAFETIAEYTRAHDDSTMADKWQKGWRTLHTALDQSARDLRCLAIAGIAALFVMACACFCPGKRLRLLLEAGSLVLSAVLMIIALAYAGRLPARAIVVAALPAAAALFMLLPACLPEDAKRPLAACAAVCAVYAGLCLYAFLPDWLIDEQQDLLMGSAMGDLEEYALYEPESLFIYDDTLTGADLRVFPDYSEGVPDNVAFWGGWTLRSPESVEQFARFGIDLNQLDPYSLLQDNVYFASGRIDPPPTVILDWLRTKIGPHVDYELYSEYGYVYIFHFAEY